MRASTIALLLLVLGISGVFATGVGTCDVISSPDSYQLTAPLSGAPNDASDYFPGAMACMIITSSNVLFDCNDFNITNDGTPDSVGIFVDGYPASLTNVTIRNCPNISSQYLYGVYAYDTSNSTFRNITFFDLANGDLLLQLSHNNSVLYNAFSGGSGDAISISESENNSVLYNTFSGESTGVSLGSFSNNNFVLYNNFTGNNYGFYVYEADNNQIGYNNIFSVLSSNFGSCPLVYGWNGTDYDFVGDISGSGTLGTPRGDGTYRQPTPGDYSEIPSSLMAEANGSYGLQVTQEYDEISYLDQLSLITVDHAPGYDVLPTLLRSDNSKYYSISQTPSHPLSCTDQNGNDCLPAVLNEDGAFTEYNSFQTTVLDVSLGDLSGSSEIKFIANSFSVFDNTSSSTKFVQVAGPSGTWVTVYNGSQIIRPAGFPRDQVINLTGKFPTSNYTVRLGFDRVRFDYIAVDTTPEQAFAVNTYSPVSADLHFRGYSSTSSGILPYPDYYDATNTSRLSSPIGNFTKFGDVASLMDATDDKFVVMHHGDEITVQFPYSAVPPGQQRDFLLYSWDYYKSSTNVHGSTVNPLPFRNMSNYPYPSNESYPTDAEHLAYLSEWNTRQYNSTEPSQAGISLPYSFNNTVFNNNISGVPGITGLYLSYEEDTSISNNTITGFGTCLLIEQSSGTMTSGNNISDCSVAGMLILDSDQTSLANDYFSNNAFDFCVNENTGGTIAYSATGLIFDNPDGSMTSFTNVSIYDSLASEFYTIAWNPDETPPPDFAPFSNFVIIQVYAGSPQIESISWHWNADQASGHSESAFTLQKHYSLDSTVWEILNDTPDVSARLLGVTDLILADDVYAILENLTASPPITLNSIYTIPPVVYTNTTAYCAANVTGNGSNTIQSVYFNITYPDTSVLELGNGTQDGDIWTSAAFLADQYGDYNCTVFAFDNQSNTSSGALLFAARNPRYYNFSDGRGGHLVFTDSERGGAGPSDCKTLVRGSGYELCTNDVPPDNIQTPDGVGVQDPEWAYLEGLASINWDPDYYAFTRFVFNVSDYTHGAASDAFFRWRGYTGTCRSDGGSGTEENEGYYLYARNSEGGYDLISQDSVPSGTSLTDTEIGIPNFESYINPTSHVMEFVVEAVYPTGSGGSSGFGCHGSSVQADYVELNFTGAPFTWLGNYTNISASGNYMLSGNLSGAPVAGSEIGVGSCIKIAASNVIFDCGGNSIANNGTSGATAAIAINGSPGNELANITIRNCGDPSGFTYGVYVSHAQNAHLSNIVAHSNTYGVYVLDSNNTSLSGVTFYNNTLDLLVNNTGASPFIFNMSQALFLNPSGTTYNYTALSIYDLADPSSAYSVTWSQNSSALPAHYVSFAGKYVDISALSGAPVLDSLSWRWSDAETSGYDKSRFVLYKYNSSGWAPLNDTPDTSSNTLSLSNLAPGSIYGILQNNITICPVIDSPGAYQQLINYRGAPNDASPLSDFACVKIASSNVDFDCNGFNITDNGTSDSFTSYGILLNGSLTNVTFRNCPNVSAYTYGVYVYGSDNSLLENITASSNVLEGFYLEGSSNNTLAGDAAYNNNETGFYLDSGSLLNRIENSTVSGNPTGMDISSGNNTILNNTITNNGPGGNAALFVPSPYNRVINNSVSNNLEDGIYLYSGHNTTVSGNTVDNNTANGIRLDYSGNSIIQNNTAQENGQYDFYILPNNDNDCNNLVTDLVGSGGRPINYTNGTVSWDSLFVSELVLCNADNSDLDNITVRGSASIRNNGLLVARTDGATIRNSNSSLNYLGFYFNTLSSGNTLSNNTASDNFGFGFSIQVNSNNNLFVNNIACNTTSGSGFSTSSSSWYNTFTNNTAYGNSYDGFSLFSDTEYDNLTNNTAYDNSRHGFHLETATSNNFTANLAYGNALDGFFIHLADGVLLANNSAFGNAGNGTVLYRADNVLLAGEHYYNNTIDLFVKEDAGLAMRVNGTGLVFDNPAGNFTYYTNISFNDVVGPVVAWSISWSPVVPPPGGFIPFADKFVSINSIAGSVSIDKLVWSWSDDEVSAGGYNESRFQLWEHGSLGWSILNNTPDTSAHTLAVLNLDPASAFTILQNNASACPAPITVPGTYIMNSSFYGAPNLDTETGIKSCVKILTSNVTFDCNGSSITNNGTVNAAAFFINYSSNVTVENCPQINGYGFFIRYSNGTIVRNLSVYGGTFSMPGSSHGSYSGIYTWGFILQAGSVNNTFENIIANRSIVGSEGFHLDNTCGNNTFINDTAIGSPNADGFYFESPNNVFINCTSYGNYARGFVGFSGDSNTTFIGNTAYNNNLGFVMSFNSNNVFINNTAFNSSNLGFSAVPVGFLISHVTNSTFIGNRAYNNTYYGFQADTACHNNTYTGNSAYNNTLYGFYLNNGDSDNNLTNNSAYLNGYVDFFGARNGGGIYFYNTGDTFSNRNTFANNTVYRNTGFGMQIINANGTNMSGGHFFDNHPDIQLKGVSGSYYSIMNLTDMVFDSPAGNFTNYTNISTNASMWGDGYCTLNWTPAPDVPPAGYSYFGQKFVEVGCVFGGTLDRTTWTWSDAEAADLNKSRLGLFVYWAPWTVQNNTPDVVSNTLSLSGINGGIFGILYNTTANPSITLNSPGNGTANISATPMNVTFNFSVTDDNSTTNNCSLYLDGTQAYNNPAMMNGSSDQVTILVALGSHTWNVSCTDSVNITNSSATYGFSITAPPSPPAPPSAPPSSGTTTTPTIIVSVSRAQCPDNSVTITASSGSGTDIRLLLTDPYEGLVDEQTGESATFSLGRNGTYQATGTRLGYDTGSTTFTFTTCAGSQQPPVVPPSPPVTPTPVNCTTDAQCPDAYYCDSATSSCLPVSGTCGYAASHAWTSYQCCADADCPEGKSCIDHACRVFGLTGDTEGVVGGTGRFRATVDDAPYANAVLLIIRPDGTSFNVTTDANGEFSLTFEFQGQYSVGLVQGGTVVKTQVVTITSAAVPPVPKPGTSFFDQLLNYCWVPLVLIAAIVAYLAYRRFTGGKRKKGYNPDKYTSK